MPSLNRNKLFAAGAAYHIYNRGVNKLPIFFTKKDYVTYITFLQDYLMPRDVRIKEASKRYAGRHLNKRLTRLVNVPDFSKEIELLSYCLMPNHIHLVLIQKEAHDMTRLMRCLHTSYARYFNQRYQRVGNIFQDIYKAGLLRRNRSIVRAARYVHRNPIPICQDIKTYLWSSFRYHTKQKHLGWIHTERLERIFEKSSFRTSYNSYTDFVEDQHEP